MKHVGLLDHCETLEETVDVALEMARRTDDSQEVGLIAIALLAKIRAWMDDVAMTVMDGPAKLPESVKAEDARLREESNGA